MIREALGWGSKRSLGKVDEIVAHVLTDQTLMPELFVCAYDSDELVRMRAADALEKICRVHPDWLKPFLDEMLTELVGLDQPSVRWHLAQILGQVKLEASQKVRAVEFIRKNLSSDDDWLVVICSMDTFAQFARHDHSLRNECVLALQEKMKDPRKAVAKKAQKLRSSLG